MHVNPQVIFRTGVPSYGRMDSMKSRYGLLKCDDSGVPYRPIPLVGRDWLDTFIQPYEMGGNNPRQSLCCPLPGYNNLKRVGTTIFIHKILVKGNILINGGQFPSETINAIARACTVRLLLVHDTRPEEEPVQGDYIIQNSRLTDLFLPVIFGHTELFHSDRFEILDEILVEMPEPQVVYKITGIGDPAFALFTNNVIPVIPASTESALEGTVGLAAGTGGPIALIGTSATTIPTVDITGQIVTETPLAVNGHYQVMDRYKRFELAYEFPEPIKKQFYTSIVDGATYSRDSAINIYAAIDQQSVDAKITFLSRAWFSDTVPSLFSDVHTY